MQAILITKLYNYLRGNNPDLLFVLQRDGLVTAYLQQKIDGIAILLHELEAQATPAYIIEEVCMDAMTKDLRPSRFNYISAILEEEFETHYNRFRDSGILTCEIINMADSCGAVFEAFGFSAENEDDPQLRYAIMGTIHGYLTADSEQQNSEQENVAV